MPLQAPDFALFFDDMLTRPTCYHAGGEYFAKARDRMDNTYALIRPYVAGKIVVDVGASPFYLLDRAKEGGAARAHGIYFANDDHPLRDAETIHSRNGPIELSHADVEVAGFPFADDEVDVVTACEILEHFDHFPTRLAMEVRRILKPGGHLCITVPNVASIGNIIKLIFQKNIYMKYRADATGRHKHEFTLAQLKAFIAYMGMDVVKAGFLPTPTSDLYALRPIYRAIAKTPGVKHYSPTLFILARQPQAKPGTDLSVPPPALFDDTQSIEA